jgi:peptidoglycan hydrolase CwlO-like protein
MDESQKLSDLYKLRDNLSATLRDINHEIGEKKVISDELTRKLHKAIGAIEFLEQEGIRLPQI